MSTVILKIAEFLFWLLIILLLAFLGVVARNAIACPHQGMDWSTFIFFGALMAWPVYGFIIAAVAIGLCILKPPGSSKHLLTAGLVGLFVPFLLGIMMASGESRCTIGF